MIRKFLSYSVEKRARRIIWLYDRYVMEPALEELHDIAMLLRLADEELEVQFTPDFEPPSIH